MTRRVLIFGNHRQLYDSFSGPKQEFESMPEEDFS